MSYQASKELKDIAQRALESAQQRGAKGIRVGVSRSRETTVTYRKGKTDKIQEAGQRNLSVHVYIDGQYSSSSTNDLRPKAVDKFLDTAVALARAMKADPFRVMPDPALYAGRKELELELFDPSVNAVTPKDRNDYAAAIDSAAMQAAGDKAIQAEGSYEESEGESYKLHSNGFEGSRRGTQFWGWVDVSCQDEGDKRPSGWAVGGSRKRAGLPPAEQVGRDAADYAKSRCGAKKLPTETLPMIVENRSVGRFLGYLMQATGGSTLQQKRSFLEGMEGKKLGSELLTLTDDPFVVGGFGSRLCDGEGIAAKVMPVFDKGVFKNFYIDTYYGKKLERPPTTGGQSNLVMPPGEKSLDELIKGMDRAILVRGFIGGNSNSTTGDFSLGVFGTLIENGQRTQAVAEMNVAGNHKEVWQRLVSAGSDPWLYGSTRVPSLVFDGIQFAGA